MNYSEKLKEKEEQLYRTLQQIETINKEIKEIHEKIHIEDDNFIKCICINCDGNGWIQEDNRKIKCPVCDGRRYMWVKKFKE